MDLFNNGNGSNDAQSRNTDETERFLKKFYKDGMDKEFEKFKPFFMEIIENRVPGSDIEENFTLSDYRASMESGYTIWTLIVAQYTTEMGENYDFHDLDKKELTNIGYELKGAFTALMGISSENKEEGTGKLEGRVLSSIIDNSTIFTEDQKKKLQEIYAPYKQI